MDPQSAHSKSHEALLETFKTSFAGLSSQEAQDRKKEYGPNAFIKEKTKTPLQKFFKHLTSPLVIILLAACVVTIFLHEVVDALVIGIALVINIIIGMLQEGRADTAFTRLSSFQERFATVIRDNRKQILPAEELVPGDIVEDRAGGAVPADIRILKAHEVSVNEAPLTGESLPVEKNSDPVSSEAALTKQTNMLWMGTFVLAGSITGVVVATGQRTQVGGIAQALQGGIEAQTPIERNISRLARFLAFIVVLIICVLFILGIARGETFITMLTLAIAVAVSVIPEGLPAAVTAVLAIGMEKLLSRGGLVRNMLTAETLGSTTTILTDKTGTLTKGLLSFRNAVTLQVVKDEEGKDQRDILQAATLALDVFIEDTKEGKIVRGQPIEKAIVEAALENDSNAVTTWNTYTRLDTIPFESKNRFSGTLVHGENREAPARLCLIGAPEVLLAASNTVYYSGEEIRLGKKDHEELRVAFEQASRDGLRVIAVAWKDVSWKKAKEGIIADDPASLLSHLVFGGLLVFEDPIREDARESVLKARGAGARVIMLTGDNSETARNIAREVGIIENDHEVLLGSDIDTLSDEQLQHELASHSVFARILPLQKMRIVEQLQKMGEIVAMTGDGINDAPALKKAHIGIALGSGTDEAKEAADLILIHNSFAIIVAAVEEGRRIMDNLKKIVSHLLSTSFGEVFVIAGAIIAGTYLPVLPVQILWLNVIEEGFLSFAFAF